MKLLCLFLFLAIVIQLSCWELGADALSSNGFVRTKGVQFSLNGYPYYANGFNAYWLMYVASDPSQRSKISTAFQDASRHGLTVARTWAFSDGGYRALQYSPGSYNEDMFQVTSIRPYLSVCYVLIQFLELSMSEQFPNFGGKMGLDQKFQYTHTTLFINAPIGSSQ